MNGSSSLTLGTMADALHEEQVESSSASHLDDLPLEIFEKILLSLIKSGTPKDILTCLNVSQRWQETVHRVRDERKSKVIDLYISKGRDIRNFFEILYDMSLCSGIIDVDQVLSFGKRNLAAACVVSSKYLIVLEDRDEMTAREGQMIRFYSLEDMSLVSSLRAPIEIHFMGVYTGFDIVKQSLMLQKLWEDKKGRPSVAAAVSVDLSEAELSADFLFQGKDFQGRDPDDFYFTGWVPWNTRYLGQADIPKRVRPRVFKCQEFDYLRSEHWTNPVTGPFEQSLEQNIRRIHGSHVSAVVMDFDHVMVVGTRNGLTLIYQKPTRPDWFVPKIPGTPWFMRNQPEVLYEFNALHTVRDYGLDLANPDFTHKHRAGKGVVSLFLSKYDPDANRVRLVINYGSEVQVLSLKPNI